MANFRPVSRNNAFDPKPRRRDMAFVSFIKSERGNEFTSEGRNCLEYLFARPANLIIEVFPSGPTISFKASSNAENTICLTFSAFFLDAAFLLDGRLATRVHFLAI